MIEDVRNAIRSMLRRPGFALVAMATFALGIGANTAIFSVVDGILWKPLPFADPDRLLALVERDVFTGGERLNVAPANFLDLRDQTRSFTGVAAIEPSGVDLLGRGVPETLPSSEVTEGFFDIVGTPMLFGRGFEAGEHIAGRDHVVVLSHTFWRDRTGSDPEIVGEMLDLDGQPHEIIGVLPAEFRLFRESALWLPDVTQEYYRTNRQSRAWTVVARLAPGVTLDEAQNELEVLAGRLAGELPETNRDTRFDAVPIGEMLTGKVREGLFLLLAAVGAVLLVACVNLVNLFLARASERETEIGIRAALGAGRARLARQGIVETSVLALVGGAAGLALARFGIDAILALGPNTLPRAEEIAIDLRVLGFAAAVTVGTALLVGLAPAIRFARPRNPLRSSTRGTIGAPGRRLRETLVALEIALAFVLLVGAGLFGRSLGRILSVDPGFHPNGVLVLQLFVWDRYDTAAERIAFFREAAERLEAMPQVEAVGGSSSLPFAEVKIDIDTGVSVSGEDLAHPGFVAMVTERYFGAMRIPIRRGRAFEVRDGLDAPRVAILSETMARHLFGDVDPIGRRIRMQYGRPADYEVVGIAGDVKQLSVLDPGRADVYLPHAQSGPGHMTLAVRTSGGGDALAHATAVQAAIWKINPTLPIYTTHTMEGLMANSLEQRRFVLALLAGFAGIALVLAAIGIYGVMSFNASRRIPEMGIRSALGATRGEIGRLVLGEAARVVAAGLLAGAFAALLLGRFVESMLFGMGSRDPLTFLALALVLSAVAFAACWMPARRAMRVDPAVALRYE